MDLIEIIKTIGILGVFAVVFAESGLFFGFFLPGDSLLFTAGFLASQGYLNIYVLVIGCAIAAILGDSVGYSFGKKVGPKIFKKEDSLIFKKEYIEKAKSFYEKHGKKTIILARFVPFVRTFAPILAGVGDMKYSIFLSYNIIGGILWAVGITLAGFFLGNIIPDVDKYLLPIIMLIIFVSTLPTIFEFTRQSKPWRRLVKSKKSHSSPKVS